MQIRQVMMFLKSSILVSSVLRRPFEPLGSRSVIPTRLMLPIVRIVTGSEDPFLVREHQRFWEQTISTQAKGFLRLM